MEQLNRQNKVIYDYMTIRFRGYDAHDILDLLHLSIPLENFEHTYGRYGYRYRYIYNGISINYNPKPSYDIHASDDVPDFERYEKMGTLLEMSGQGCRCFETYGSGDFEKILALCSDDPENLHITRLDVAYDDFEKKIDLETICNDVKSQSYVSRARKWLIEIGSDGTCVYIGSKKSEMLIRMYDKAAERGYDNMHWVRLEMQLRGNNAQGFADIDGLNIGHKFSGVLLNYLRFVDPVPGDSNRWRWPMKEYWLNILTSLEPISIATKPGLDYNMLNVQRYVSESAGNAIDCVIQVYGAVKFLELIRQRKCRPNPKYQRIIDECKQLGISPELQFEEFELSQLPDFAAYFRSGNPDPYKLPYVPEAYRTE